MIKKSIVTIIFLGIALCANIYFRIFTVNFPQLKPAAASQVEQKIIDEATQQVNKEFPDFSVFAKNRLIQTLSEDYKKNNKEKIAKQVQEEYLKLKEKYQDENGQTYLLETDCWHWARYVENTARLGHPGDRVKDSYAFDALMLAPSGSYVTGNQFLFYLSAFLYKAFSFVKPVPLLNFLFFLPLFFSAIFIIALYLFCQRYGGNLAAFITCLFVGLAPALLTHSCAGWFDMDVLNLLFPLLVVWAYVKAYECVSWKQRIFWIFLSAFCVGLFCFNWTGWWFIFCLIIVYELFSLLNMLFVYWQHKEKNLILSRQRVISLALFIVFSFLFCRVLARYTLGAYLFDVVKGCFHLNAPRAAAIWPNVYSTVIELTKSDFLMIIALTGGVVAFVLSWMSLLGLFLTQRKYFGSKREAIVIFTFWALAMLLASLGGTRFMMFAVIPLGVALGWAISEAHSYLKNKQKILRALFMVIIMSLTVLFLNRAYYEAINIFPFMNDAWYSALKELKDKTPQEAVINSWWDYGSWFRAVSKRRVIFDGQSQNTPQAYWMASVLMSQDEEEAVRILRMLNNGANKPFEILNESFNDPLEAVFLVKSILVKADDAAKEKLFKRLRAPEASEMNKLLFNSPGKAYFVVDYTMLAKVSSISYLANWDFLKAYISKNLNQDKNAVDALAKIGIDKEKARGLYQEAGLVSQDEFNDWVSSRYKFYSGIVFGKEQNGQIFFDNGVIYNPGKKIAHVYSFRDGRYKIPQSLFVLENGLFQEISYPDTDLELSVVILKNQDKHQLVLADRNLANSLLFRLYFLNGQGLKHFKPFIEAKDGDNYIRIFEISWD